MSKWIVKRGVRRCGTELTSLESVSQARFVNTVCHTHSFSLTACNVIELRLRGVVYLLNPNSAPFINVLNGFVRLT